MNQRTPFSFGREVAMPYKDALARVRTTLQEQGFGILTEIDVREKLREKLGVEFPPYIILGACNPRLAHQALGAEPELGALLPCNVVVREKDPATTIVSAMDPIAALGLVENPQVQPIARQVRTLIEQALAAL